MPKAQKKAITKKAPRSEPLSARNVNATKKPKESEKSAAEEETVNEDKTKGSTKKASTDTATEGEAATQNAENPNNYLVQVVLSGTEDPTISRILSLSPHLNFAQLDQILQTAFGWTNSHMHSFDICLVDEEPINPMGPPVKLTLCPDPSNLPEDLDNKKESDYTLADIYEKPEWKDRVVITYEYDPGDSWNHQIALLGRATPGTNAQFGVPKEIGFFCIGGEGHGVAEDAGGIGGWEDLKEAFQHPRKQGSRELVSWYKGSCFNGDKKGLDPYKWDVMDVNDELAVLNEKAGFGRSEDD